MISVSEAWQIVASTVPALRVTKIPLEAAANRVLRQRVDAERDQPPFHRATMDGIALMSASPYSEFRIQGTVAAGAPAPALQSDAHCVEIMTGAVMPENADCVIPVEDIRIENQLAVLGDDARKQAWRFVHRQGTDYQRGDPLLTEGLYISPAEVAVLASTGVADVPVSEWPAISVFSTGDELRPAEAKHLEPYQIRRANDYAIAAGLRGMGLTDVTSHHLPDDREIMRTELARAIESGRWLILTGGVSKGKFDYLPEVLSNLGAQKHFHRIAQRPGKPMWFGTVHELPLFALPGNPVSALVCFRRYVIPALLHAAECKPRPHSVRMQCDLSKSIDLTQFVPVREVEHGLFQPVELNTSGDFYSLAGSAGFVEIDARSSHISARESLPFFPWQA